MSTIAETPGARLLRHLKNHTGGYRRRMLPALPEARARELAEYLESVERLAEQHTRAVDEIASSRELSDEGRRARLGEVTARTLATLARLDETTAQLSEELDTARAAARRGLITAQGRREATPTEAAERRLDLLLRSQPVARDGERMMTPLQHRTRIYLEAAAAGDWLTTDAVETAPAWADAVPGHVVDRVQRDRAADLPIVQELTRVVSTREDVSESLQRSMSEIST